MLSPGGESEEAMTGKLEATRKVIEEVNKQFKNPVSLISLSQLSKYIYQYRYYIPLVLSLFWSISHFQIIYGLGYDYVCLRMYSRISIAVWNGEIDSRTGQIPNRYGKYYHQPSFIPREGYVHLSNLSIQSI